MSDYFRTLESIGVTKSTLVELGVIEDILEDVILKTPNDSGLHIFANMLARLFQDEARRTTSPKYHYNLGNSNYSSLADQFYYSGRNPPIEILRMRSKKSDYNLGLSEDFPMKVKPPVFSVDMITTDSETLYILINQDGSVDEYAKFTNLEKYVTSKNATIHWLGDEEKRPLSLLWNEEDDAE